MKCALCPDTGWVCENPIPTSLGMASMPGVAARQALDTPRMPPSFRIEVDKKAWRHRVIAAARSSFADWLHKLQNVIPWIGDEGRLLDTAARGSVHNIDEDIDITTPEFVDN
jgi:hypothetical protein